MTYLLPAPKIAGLLPAKCPLLAPAVLDVAGQLNTKRIGGQRIYITTIEGTFAVLDDLCVGDAMALLTGQPVTIIEREELREVA
jgi:hypothetical protein